MCPSRWTIIVLAAALSAGLASSLAAAGPASAPAAGLPNISQAELASLKKLGTDTGPRHWSEPVIETFEKAPPKDTWTAGQNGQIEFKDGKMFLTTPGQNQMAMVYRTLPESLRGSEAIRVEAWVQCRPWDRFKGAAVANNPALAANRQFYQNVLFISNDPNANAFQWDYSYHFANGINGNSQSFNQLNGGGIGNGGGAQIQPGKLLHITMELTGQAFHIQRGDDDNGKMDGVLIAPFRAADSTCVGFSCRNPGMTVVQIAYRGLTTAKANIPADAWKSTPFANQDALTNLLLSRVVPALDDSHFAIREQAHELLNSLWPLSKPAIDAAIKKGGVSPEAASRLDSLQSHTVKFDIVKDADEKPIKPPVTKDLPAEDEKDKAATQADNPKDGPGGPIQGVQPGLIVRPMPAPIQRVLPNKVPVPAPN